MLVTRYFGPSNFGVISYAESIVAFVAPVMKLGLDSILVKEFVKDPEIEGEIIGTSLVLNLCSAALCIIGVFAFTMIANYGEPITIVVCVLYSLLLIFQAFEMIQYWFHAKLLAKYTAMAMLFSYVVVASFQVILLATKSPIYFFALSNALDFLIISVILNIIYRKKGGKKFKFSLPVARSMLKESKYFILSSLMITIFAHTDRIMLKFMMGDTATGFYSAAVTCAGITSFVFAAILDSFRPSIFAAAKREGLMRDSSEKEEKNGFEKTQTEQAETTEKAISKSKFSLSGDFEKRVAGLYSIIIYFSLIQCVVITVLAWLVVRIICGTGYADSVEPLRIVVWYTTFSYLGSVRNIWIVAKGKQSILLFINLGGALVNVILNLLLIPVWGINGAAVASLAAQVFSNVVLSVVIPSISRNAVLMCHGLNPARIIDALKDK
jgi:O-antigen/teichoic acid export membrane protein